MLAKRKDSLLLIIDVQERLAPVMREPRKVINGAVMLLKAARLLEIPAIVSEQYPKGLGPSMIDIRNLMPEGGPISKTAFSCFREPEILSAIKKSKKKQIIIAGIESHVCILQTALDLLKDGYEIFVVADACSSRRSEDETIAIERMKMSGINISTIEMILFEWLEKAGTDEFREISKNLIPR